MSRLLIAVAAMVLIAPLASAQLPNTIWTENFDAYNVGNLCGAPAPAVCANVGSSGGWGGWADDPLFSGIVSTAQARSGANSLDITNLDAVHPFSVNAGQPGIPYASYPTSGYWIVRAWAYVPTGGLGVLNSTAGAMPANAYFIINNLYDLAATAPNWSIQLQMGLDAANMPVIVDDQRGGNQVPIPFDTWFEIEIRANLDLDSVETLANGQTISTGIWTTAGGTAVTEIANMDLFSTGGQCFFDDISLTEDTPPSPEWQTNSANMSFDIDGIQGTAFAGAVSTVNTGDPLSLNFGSALLGMPYDLAITGYPSRSLSAGGIAALGQTLNVDIFAPPGAIFLSTGTGNIGFALPVPAPTWSLGAAGPPTITPLSASAQAIIIDPSAALGFTLSQASQLDVIVCPTPLEGFENGSLPVGWDFTTGTTSTVTWLVINALSTPSGGTGPANGASEGSFYAYCESSAPNTMATWVLTTTPLLTGATVTPNIKFDYQALGGQVGTMLVEQQDATGAFIPVGSIVGSQGINWQTVQFPVVPVAGGSGPEVVIRFTYNSNGGFQADACIDAVGICE